MTHSYFLDEHKKTAPLYWNASALPDTDPEEVLFRRRTLQKRAQARISNLIADLQGANDFGRTIVDKDLSEDRKIKNLLSELEKEQPWNYTNRIIQRIKFLQTIALEEGDEQKPLMFHSLLNFINFLKLNDYQEPSLTLTYDGHISALWHKNEKKELVIRFYESTLVKFLVFTPSLKNSSKVVKQTGDEIDIHSLFELLEILGVNRWILKSNGSR